MILLVVKFIIKSRKIRSNKFGLLLFIALELNPSLSSNLSCVMKYHSCDSTHSFMQSDDAINVKISKLITLKNHEISKILYKKDKAVKGCLTTRLRIDNRLDSNKNKRDLQRKLIWQYF